MVDNCVDDTVQLISLKQNCCVLIQISLMFVCKGLIINKVSSGSEIGLVQNRQPAIISMA